MLKVGITGGIGSGKTVVCQVFNTLGIPVFNADLAARFLMENDLPLVQSIKGLLGSEVYNNGTLDRTKVASIVFGKPDLLAKLNALVHPATIKYANEWLEEVLSIIARQMNEEEKMKHCDYVITNDDVTAVLPQAMKLHEFFLKNSISQPGQ